MTDQQIWSRIVGDDVEALRLLHDKYYYLLWLCSRKITHSDVVAEEVVSDCFIALWYNRKKTIVEKSLKAYLILTVRNLSVNYRRKANPEILVEKIPDLVEENDMVNYEFYAGLYKAISKIPEQRRKILELAAFDSLTYKEIAEKLNISVNTVKTQMGRTYQFLKNELDPKNFVLFSLIYSRIE